MRADRLQRLATLGLPPPPAGSGRSGRLRFVRDYQLRWLPINLVLLLAAVLAGVAWATILLAMGSGLLALDALWLTRRLRRQN